MSERENRKARLAAGSCMPPERAEDVAEQRRHVSGLYQELYDRVATGQTSRREAIKSKCLDCACWQRDETSNCPATSCPLWLYRPYQRPDSSFGADTAGAS